MKATYVYILLFLLFASMVYADLSLGYADQQVYGKVGEDLRIDLPCFNESSACGAVSCTFSASYPNGSIFLEHAPYSFVNTPHVNLSGSDLTAYGSYGFSAECHETSATNDDGIKAFQFHINNSGLDSKPSNLLAFLILIPLLFSLVLVFACNGMTEEHDTLKIVNYIFIYINLFATLYISGSIIVYFYFTDSALEVISTLWWLYGIAFIAFFGYFVVYFIWKGILMAGQRKEERLKY